MMLSERGSGEMGNKPNCNSQQIHQQRGSSTDASILLPLTAARAKAAGLIWMIYFSLTPWSHQEMSQDLEQQPEQSNKSAVFSVSWREKLTAKEEIFRSWGGGVTHGSCHPSTSRSPCASPGRRPAC